VWCGVVQLQRRAEQMKKNLEQQEKELEEKMKAFEAEREAWEEQYKPDEYVECIPCFFLHTRTIFSFCQTACGIAQWIIFVFSMV